MRGGLLHEFTQNYLDAERASLAARYPDVESYIHSFDAETLLPGLVEYAAAHGVERDEAGLETSRRWLASQLKALIAGRLWDMAAYYRVFNCESDALFAKARTMMMRWLAATGSAATAPAVPYPPVSEEFVRRLAE